MYDSTISFVRAQIPIILNSPIYFTILGNELIFKTKSRDIIDSILQNLRDILGDEVYDVVMSRIISCYFGKAINVRTALAEDPELFESALLSLLGEMGKILLAKSLDEISAETIGGQHYSKSGDFARYIRKQRVPAMVSRKH
jgi:hypothetical protein